MEKFEDLEIGDILLDCMESSPKFKKLFVVTAKRCGLTYIECEKIEVNYYDDETLFSREFKRYDFKDEI